MTAGSVGSARDSRVDVIGASVAGLFAAYHLARRGVPVRVFEARPFFDPDPRTLIVTSVFLKFLGLDAEEIILNRTRTFELISRSNSVRIPLYEPDLIIERSLLLKLLLQKAEEAGVEIVFGNRLFGLENHRHPLLLRFSTEKGEKEVASSRVVGADGVTSIARPAVQKCELHRVALLQVKVPLPGDLSPDTVRVWFHPESTRFFYWIIPESPTVAVAGLIAETPEQASRLLKAFISAQGLEPLDLPQEGWAPLHRLALRWGCGLGDGHIVLAGDAAGQVKVTTVGGVVTSMRGALGAVQALLEGGGGSWESRLLRAELNFHAMVRQALDGFDDRDYDILLGMLNQRGIRVLAQYPRDQLGVAIWRLLPAQPRWLWLGARALAKNLLGRLQWRERKKTLSLN